MFVCIYIYLKITAPGAVERGSQTIGIIVPSKSMSGTRGVVRWNMGGDLNRVLSVMWSVPYNRQFWRQWVAVGLSASGQEPSYDVMYRGDNKDKRFVRHEANGKTFEFSDGRFIINARMDGSTYKPILHLSIAPRMDAELAPSILKFLGIKPNTKLLNNVRSRSPRGKLANADAGALPSTDAASGAFSVLSYVSSFHKNTFWHRSFCLILIPMLRSVLL